MRREVRIVLYVLSMMTVIGVFMLVLLSGGKTNDRDVISESDKNQLASEALETEQNTEVAGESVLSTEVEESETELAVEETEAEPLADTVMMFTGDVLFTEPFISNYESGGIEQIVTEELLTQLQNADILMVNNEFPFSTRGTKAEDKQYTFEVDPKYVTGLTDMGVDIVSLANNHTLDYGRDAMEDTFATLDDAGILYGGAGDSVERAQEVQVIEKNGKKFAFIAVSRVIPEVSWKVENATPGIFSCYDDTRLVEIVGEASAEYDFVTVFVHWGIERNAYPESYQKQIAEKCVNAGADLIVGAHPHCLQGIDIMDGTPVFYSLGNFIFGSRSYQTAAVKVTVKVDGTSEIQLVPAAVASGTTSLLTGSEASSLYQYVNSISEGTVLDENGYVVK